jgi:hypothetical protein
MPVNSFSNAERSAAGRSGQQTGSSTASESPKVGQKRARPADDDSLRPQTPASDQVLSAPSSPAPRSPLPGKALPGSGESTSFFDRFEALIKQTMCSEIFNLYKNHSNPPRIFNKDGAEQEAPKHPFTLIQETHKKFENKSFNDLRITPYAATPELAEFLQIKFNEQIIPSIVKIPKRKTIPHSKLFWEPKKAGIREKTMYRFAIKSYIFLVLGLKDHNNLRVLQGSTREKMLQRILNLDVFEQSFIKLTHSLKREDGDNSSRDRSSYLNSAELLKDEKLGHLDSEILEALEVLEPTQKTKLLADNSSQLSLSALLASAATHPDTDVLVKVCEYIKQFAAKRFALKDSAFRIILEKPESFQQLLTASAEEKLHQKVLPPCVVTPAQTGFNSTGTNNTSSEDLSASDGARPSAVVAVDSRAASHPVAHSEDGSWLASDQDLNATVIPHDWGPESDRIFTPWAAVSPFGLNPESEHVDDLLHADSNWNLNTVITGENKIRVLAPASTELVTPSSSALSADDDFSSVLEAVNRSSTAKQPGPHLPEPMPTEPCSPLDAGSWDDTPTPSEDSLEKHLNDALNAVQPVPYHIPFPINHFV